MPERPTSGDTRPPSNIFPRIAAMMLLQYWPLGVWAVTVGTYIGANTGEQGAAIFSAGFIGFSTISGAIGSLVSPLVFGFLSDRFLAADRLVALLHVGCAAAAWWMHSTDSEQWFFVALLLYWNCFNPSCSLTNKIALEHLSDPERQYPHARLFATGGWISAGLFIGVGWPWLFGAEIESTGVPLAIGAWSSLAMAAYALSLPRTRPMLAERGGQQKDRRPTRGLASNRPLIGFLVIAALAVVPSMAYNNYANLFLNWAGYPSPAALMTLGQLSDLMCLAALPMLSARLGLSRVFFLGVLAWSVRYGLLTLASSLGWTAAVYGAIIVHGPCYVFVYVAGVMIVDQLSGPAQRGAAQGLNAIATGGVGHLGGALLVGFMQQASLTPEGVSPPPYDWSTFWLAPAILSTATAVAFAMAFLVRGRAARRAAPDPQRAS
ncbi:putative nucleoside transporter YegT [Posidoniimonas polymericola]|uniref:Putative nucleoside transporter YegT n=1 Tax=Posidoniimonas polymericola TaxID=2528002 RepID=A0A5C5YQQ3_9BACT|nr:MFS transporter [Posidoniimonas polymericola]TWT77245.1 putative nucleoside transporter YegT [Posidoniimonas polymericola]